MWGNRFKISNEQFTKIKFANDKTGWKLATSVGGIGVGERGDRFIIDDPNNTMDMESEQIRDTTNMWFTEVVPDRLNNPQESSIVIIQQRLHEDDVSGIAISREMGYTHLMIPMEHDPSRHCVTVIGMDELGNDVTWEDPRTEDCELAWPERFTQEVCDGLKRDKGPHAWAGQYMQSPEPRGGSIIKRHFWQMWEQDKFPNFEFMLGSLDTAYTEKQENDASALTIWGVFRDDAGNPKMMLVYAWQERLEFHELIQRVIDTCTVSQAKKLTPQFSVDKLIIESKASGMSIGQELHRMFRGTGKLGIDLINPGVYGDKVARVHAIQHLFADGMIYAPDKAWADMVIDQCAIFPKGSRDDLVDSTSQALRYLRDTGFALKREEHSVVVEDEMMYRSPSSMQPLYPI
jgi:predicted phage terminase large subunit-like protein